MTNVRLLKSNRKTPRSIRSLGIALALVLPVMIMLTAGSSVTLAQQSTSPFATGLTTPAGGLVLSGTAINPATGNPVRYLWTADVVNGLCRLDPDVDTAVAHTVNQATCLNTAAGAAFNAGQLTFDPVSNTIYAVDGGGKAGIFVLHFLPNGDSGKGLMDQVNQSVLGSTCGIAGNQPTATSLGPDSNLYVGFRRIGNIMRVNAPLTNPLPCTNVQPTVIVTGDKLTSQMAWVSHALFLNSSRTDINVTSADTCLTPQNGNTVCSPSFSGLAIPSPTTVVSDQTAGQLNGHDVYFGGITNVTAYLGLTQIPSNPVLENGTLHFNYGGNFFTIDALTVDSSDPANPVLYVSDDQTPGGLAPTGRWMQVLSAPPAPAPPSGPGNVVATAGDASATLNWAAPANHQPVTSYTVRNTLASNGSVVPDVSVVAAAGATIVPTSATVTGLTNGVTYQFAVLATNSQGSSSLSAPSNSVTPQAPTVPGAPTNVLASTVGNTFVTVSWTAPASDGGSPITGYTVSTFTGGVLVSTTPAFPNSATVFPLTAGVAYTFSVHATNAIGNGPESAASAPATPGAGPNVTITVTGPASVIAGANAVYTLVATNVGSSAASGVTVSDSGTNATVSSVTTSQGACTIVSNNVSCNLGNMAAGNSVTVTVTLKPSAQTTNTVTVSSSAGSNSASATTNVIPLNQTTDVQVIGSAQNGGPAVTASDIFTWQVKNNQSLAANAVHFTSTLAPSMVLQSVNPSVGTCAAPAAGTAGATFTCDLATLNGGQAMVITVAVTFNAVGTVSTTGNATFNGTDDNPANNSASITIGVK